jgi:multiple antibiotic resistance protein
VDSHLDVVKFGVGLFAILNPVGIAPLYLALTEDDDAATRRRGALIAAVAVAVTLGVVLLAGRQLLALFSISVDDLRVAGGLIVLLIALSMLNGKPSAVHTSDADMQDGKKKSSPAVVPLAIPMLSGPGAMATVIVTAGEATSLASHAILFGTILVNAVVCYVLFRVAVPLDRRLGTSGMNIIVRVMGLILAAIAVDMMATGLRGEFPLLRGG